MPRIIAMFMLAGLAWVFLLSIPVGQGKTAFDLAHYFLVDSAPVNWISQQFSKTVAKTETATEDARAAADHAWSQGSDRLSDYRNRASYND